ncbi:MAG: MTH938/NDUFAF3 family protein [Thermodesulfobacteriota bacterium]|nr:MTH938/NDUFAF3 family protein [Thermodesulfobacteriota bacterium]
MTIEHYEFGKIVIDKKIFTSDIIIYPEGRVEDHWWRKQGHRLTREDIQSLIAAEPEVIVAGTGNNGQMKPEPGLEAFLAGRNIQLIARPSSEAIIIFNDRSTREKTGACFHLTC